MQVISNIAKRKVHRSAGKLVSRWPGRFCLLLGAVFGWLLSNGVASPDLPPSPSAPWAPPQLGQYERELAARGEREKAQGVSIDPRKVYDLPDLIDVAQRSNPNTRVAWERAKQAAAGLGLNRSAYYPYLVASAGAGYSRTVIPAPSENFATGQLVGNTLLTENRITQATLGLQWLLLDFGQRDAAVNAAKAQLMMANVGFNATHQQIVFAVSRKFYALNNARQQVTVAKSALAAAQTVEQAVSVRLAQGLATKPELLQARQQSAQSDYELEAATGQESDALVALMESLGIPPTSRLQIVDISGKPLPPKPGEPVDRLIDLALSQRPDLVAKLAGVRAKQAEVRKARAAYYPKVTLTGEVGQERYKVGVDDSNFNGDTHTVYGAALTVELPLFDGFARRERLRLAEAALRGAESELADTSDQAVREVWKAYTDFNTALRKEDAANRLQLAATTAYEAVLDSYRNGLSTYVEVVTAEKNATAARSVVQTTRAAIFDTAVALAFNVGDLAKPQIQQKRKP